MTEDTDDPLCNECGKPKSAHGIDQYTGRQVKCPVALGDMGHTASNNEHRRERHNVARASKRDEVDGPLCASTYGKPHEATHEEQTDSGQWRPVCQSHVDPTRNVRELFPNADY